MAKTNMRKAQHDLRKFLAPAVRGRSTFFRALKVQVCAPAKVVAAKVRLAVAGKFPIIPKGYSRHLYLRLATPSYGWNYGQ